MDNLTFLFNTWMKFFFLFTPFFVLSMFMGFTRECSNRQRNQLATHSMLTVAALCVGLMFFGDIVFAMFGITLDAFRVGAGAMLFLSAIPAMQGKEDTLVSALKEDVTVVPLAMPIVVGPATIGALLVLAGGMNGALQKLLGAVAVVLAVFCLWIILRLGTVIEKALGQRGLRIMTKITGLVLSALAAQMILAGIKHFFEN
jgi:multiple antibiotic resistance protein